MCILRVRVKINKCLFEPFVFGSCFRMLAVAVILFQIFVPDQITKKCPHQTETYACPYSPFYIWKMPLACCVLTNGWILVWTVFPSSIFVHLLSDLTAIFHAPIWTKVIILKIFILFQDHGSLSPLSHTFFSRPTKRPFKTLSNLWMDPVHITDQPLAGNWVTFTWVEQLQPHPVCDATLSSLLSFKAKLKTFLFSQYFHPN